jgi:hypothetical protein
MLRRNLLNTILLADISTKKASILRILIYGLLFLVYVNRTIALYAELPLYFWRPSGLIQWLPFLAPPLTYFSWIEIIWKISLFTSMIGFFAPLSKLLATLGALFVAQYDQHFSVVLFNNIPSFFLTFFMLFLRDNDFWSVDSLFKREKKLRTSSLPIICFQIFLSGLYFFSAIQKLRSSGTDWIRGLSFIDFIQKDYLVWFQDSSILGICATFTVLLELLSPLIFFRRVKLPFTLTLIGFHLLIGVTLNIWEPVWMISLLTFFFV